MQRFFLLGTLCIISCLADDKVKNATAAGSYGTYYDTYTQPVSYVVPPPPPPPPPPQPNYGPYAGYQFVRLPPPPLVDRDVCDLDASVLLVAQSKRHGHRDHYGHHLNRAYRVRCSVIANYDEDSCNVCCQHAARRDKNLQNKQFVGFLAVTEDYEPRPREDSHEGSHERSHERSNERDSREHDRDPCESGEETECDRSRESVRDKRHIDHDDHDEHDRVDSREFEEEKHLGLAKADFKPGPYYKNVKCVCCAPKRPLPPPPPPIYQAPPVVAQPAQAHAQPVYQGYKA